jgi:hypothetical protein
MFSMAGDRGEFEAQRRIAQDRARHQDDRAHATIETYHIEQDAAQAGTAPDPAGTDAVPPQPTLIQRILKALGLRR